MASQQPPARPWFRLATMAARSAPPPQPDPIAQPRPGAIRPAFRALPTQTQESTPSAPQAPVSAPPPPVATKVPPTSVAPVTRSPPTAPAPAPVPTRPLSQITTVTPAPTPPITQSPSTAKRSSPSTLFQVSAAPEATPTPITPLPSSSSVPQSPKPKSPSPLHETVYSPAPKTVSQAQVSAPKPSPYEAGSINAPATNSTYFTKPVSSQPNTPSASPSNRRIVHPPSPLTLPPAQLKSDNERELKYPMEFEQKAVLVQETKEKPKLFISEPCNTENPHKGDREASKKHHHKDKGNHNNSSNPNSSGTRIITIAGDNKGAIMELRPSRKNQDLSNKPGNFPGKFRTLGEAEKSRSRSSSSSSSSEEGKSKKDGKHESMTKTLSLPYVNSNVQAVNNSILFDANCTHHDPGVHISLSRTMGAGRGFKVKKHMNVDD